jgi:hypothetical protein
MDFFAVNLFLALYYIRPHEWISWVGHLHPILLSVVLAIIAVMRRPEGIHWREFFKTPHDWMMLTYFLWFVGSNRDPISVFKDINNVFAFYWITVLTLTNSERILKFLTWWNMMILAVAAMAIASEFGIDPTHSYEITDWRMKGRLSLNTSIFDNPNALGHSIVGALVMLYFLGFWNRSVVWKIFTPVVMILPLSCIYLTASKGAFLSGFATIINALTFRRPMAVKILIFTLAGTLGWLALNALPRMQELEYTRNNQAINGRVAAFGFGLEVMHKNLAGIGYNTFDDRFFEKNHYHKTAHSSYVEAGTELGEPGLYLFLGILYCCFRTLLTAKTTNDEEERIRRVLFGLFVSYTVSSWMICWTYRATFFLMAAAIAAFHRQMLKHNEAPPVLGSGGIEIQLAVPAGIPTTATVVRTNDWRPAATATLVRRDERPTVITAAVLAPGEEKLRPGEQKPVAVIPGIQWNRITLLDLLYIALLTFATIQFWQYSMHKMHE